MALSDVVLPQLTVIQNPSGSENALKLRAFLANFLTACQALVTAGSTDLDLIFVAATTLTIASGVVAVTQAAHKIDTESSGASDDLDSLTGAAAETVVFVRPASGARTVVLKHAIGANKIACLGARDISLAEATDMACLYYNGTQWVVLFANTLADGLLGAANTWAALQTYGAGIAVQGPISFKDASDATKVLSLVLSTIATSTTRTLTFPDANVNLGDIAGILAENTDVRLPVSTISFFAVSGVWVRARVAAGDYTITRGIGAASEVLAIECLLPRLRTSASKGFKVTGFKLQYSIATDVLSAMDITAAYTVAPPTGSAVAVATSLGTVTYDAAHDTAGERGAIGEHTMQGTFGTPVYFNGDGAFLEFLVTVTATATAVLKIKQLQFLGSETLVDNT